METRLRLRCVLTQSGAYPDLLSIRTEDDAEASGATSFRRALKDAGFEAGDVVDIVAVRRRG